VQIDGRDFRTIDEFYEVVGAALIPGEEWGKNLDAFNDILCWPLARDKEPYVLVWKRSNLSRRRLNHGELQRHFEQRGAHRRLIERAERCQGPSAFEVLVEIIEDHPEWLTLQLE
jgi:RNAse (barnase) inhibitor barstar